MESMLSWFCWDIHSSSSPTIIVFGKESLSLLRQKTVWLKFWMPLSTKNLCPMIFSVVLLFHHVFNCEASLISWVGLSGCWTLIQGAVSRQWWFWWFHTDLIKSPSRSNIRGTIQPFIPKALAFWSRHPLFQSAIFSDLKRQIQKLSFLDWRLISEC